MASFVRATWIAVAALAWTPIAAHAQDDIGHFRVGAYFALGLGGDIDADIDTPFGSTSGSDGLDATVGFGARGEVPIHQYVVIGGNFELLTFDSDDIDREAVFDIDAWAKGRYPVEINDGLTLEPYLGIQFGLALAVLDDSDGSGDDVWPGFNVGVLAGAMLLIQEHFGVFLELGWRHHQVFHEEDTVIGNVETKLVTNQLGLHLGGLYQF
jgi:hypothetical protein